MKYSVEIKNGTATEILEYKGKIYRRDTCDDDSYKIGTRGDEAFSYNFSEMMKNDIDEIEHKFIYSIFDWCSDMDDMYRLEEMENESKGEAK